MPVRFLANGVVEVDNINEAIAWENRKLRTKKPIGRPRKLELLSNGATPCERFYHDIGSPVCTRMRKLLAIVRGRGQVGIDLPELTRSIGEQQTLVTSGTISGLVRKAMKYGLKADDLIVQDTDKLYRPGPMLRDHDPPIP